jgi:hypothetical protein
MMPNGVFSRKKELVQATVMLGDLHLNLARNSSGQERSLYQALVFFFLKISFLKSKFQENKLFFNI